MAFRLLSWTLLITQAETSSKIATNVTLTSSRNLFQRGECKTRQVASGDSCASLAEKCGISGSDFMTYNPVPGVCSTLTPYQYVCCSSGTLPDYTPKPNSDGSCATYEIVAGDTCADISTAHNLETNDLESFNENTWAWNGCSLLGVGTIICLSKGDPPMPAPLSNAVCGPQVPGTKKPANGTDLSTLNQCPLNACCDVWGQCGTTSEFCTNTTTGAPGVAKQGTNGCISNCGTDIVLSEPPDLFRSIAYFEGYNLDRPCLYMDASQLNTSKYTHLHFAFATLSSNFDIQLGNNLSTYQFKQFMSIKGPKRILTLGGWAFSTSPDTYQIFRTAFNAQNRAATAANIAQFLNNNDLDGIDIDIPGIPPGSKDDGSNYLAFLAALRGLIGHEKSISIATASSYWYLQRYPIGQIADVVDYIIYLIYDLHGQWDAGNAWSIPGCPTGSCLRSGVNLTETINSLSMITKAGVPSNKVVVGITSYGRSFQMTTPGCFTELCTFTGSAAFSNATEGSCTRTLGFISYAEIQDLIKDKSRINIQYVDQKSDTNILVYDQTQWVGYMDEGKKSSRATLYKSFNMGGTADWAVDLETYHDVPYQVNDWSTFLLDIKTGQDPAYKGTRSGNWTSLSCSDDAAANWTSYTPVARWQILDCQHAWEDAVRVWKDIDRPPRNTLFIQSISQTFRTNGEQDCESLLESNCDKTIDCNEHAGSGPAAQLIWNSLILTHEFLQIFLDVVTTFGTAVAGYYFNFWLAGLASSFSVAGGNSAKDGTLALLSGGISIAKDLASGGGSDVWDVKKEHKFQAYVGQVIDAWASVIEKTVAYLYNGSDASIDSLSKIIADGRLIQGSYNGHADDAGPHSSQNTSYTSLDRMTKSVFWGFTIPLGWTLSNNHAFILDSDVDCNAIGNPLPDYLTNDLEMATKYCYEPANKRYYLVATAGDGEFCLGTDIGGSACADSFFQPSPGLKELTGDHDSPYGSLTLETMVLGSINTYQANRNKNVGSAPPDVGNTQTVEDLYAGIVTIPGFIRLPVCSAKLARYNWKKASHNSTQKDRPGYPCNAPDTKSYCGNSTFENKGSEASPLVSDCLQLAKNIYIEGDWTVDSSGTQHQIAQFGSCKFGIQGEGMPIGNIDIYIGNQDIIDIINDAVTRFGSTGRVGAKGSMTCWGNVKGQQVVWGIY
ncbi:hypothetical protein GGR57DRAFT_489709 [Xylariaceae sp. FL1272]|nr:hypothetical protein GGR57DRAFT_489709 [Xylariaceae sp. FL1272]